MSEKILEFEIVDSETLKQIPNKYCDLVNNSFENPTRVFDISSGVGKYHEPFTPMGKKKHFISYFTKSDGCLTINTQFYKSQKNRGVILKMHLFSNIGKKGLEKFIANFNDRFEKLSEIDSINLYLKT